jgi:hypothetical protein
MIQFPFTKFSKSQALSYIPFPMQVVCKSCKTVPVMIGEKVFAKKQHSKAKTIEVSQNNTNT